MDVAERSSSSSVVSVIQHGVHEDQKPVGKSPLGWEALQELSYVHKSLSGCGASGAELPSCGCSSARTTACVLSLTGKKFSHGLTKASKICQSIHGQFNEPIHPDGWASQGVFSDRCLQFKHFLLLFVKYWGQIFLPQNQVFW